MKISHSLMMAGGFAALAAIAACGNDTGTVHDPANDPEVTKEARANFPTAMALQEKVIARSCSPTGNVCHNSKEFPDLHTAGNFVTAASKPCNQDKVDNPDQIFDGCEPAGDEIEIPSIGFRTKIGFVSGDQYTDYDVFRDIVMADAAPSAATNAAAKFLRHGGLYVQVPSNITLTAGSTTARLSGMYNLDYQTSLALNGLVGGDPNGNGIFGAEDPWLEIKPGHPEKSYLIGRITGTVPGSRMPLANQALSDPEYVAIFCWIETLHGNPQPEDAIDYDGCRFAKNPVSYAIH